MKIILCATTVVLLTTFAACKNDNEAAKQDSRTDATNSGMKMYNSDTMHMSFSYPDTWEVRKNGNRLGVFETLEDSSDDFQENIISWSEDMPIGISDSLYAQAATTEIKIKNPSLTVTKLPSKRLGENTFHLFEFDYTNADSSPYHITGYTLVKDKRGYNFSCTSSMKKAEKHTPIFESILASFKPL